MANVILTAAARADLKEIKDYIATVLLNPGSANGILKRITSDLRSLERFPELGTVIQLEESSVVYRYLVCGSYMPFYHIQGDNVIVDRVLYGRRNYMKILFGNELQEEE